MSCMLQTERVDDMTISREQAKNLLINLFDANSLTFKSMAVLKAVFDEAVSDCDEGRTEKFADYHMGRGSRPLLPSKDIEEDFYHGVEFDAEQHLKSKGIKPTPAAVAAVADFAVDFAEVPPEDYCFK